MRRNVAHRHCPEKAQDHPVPVNNIASSLPVVGSARAYQLVHRARLLLDATDIFAGLGFALSIA